MFSWSTEVNDPPEDYSLMWTEIKFHSTQQHTNL